MATLTFSPSVRAPRAILKKLSNPSYDLFVFEHVKLILRHVLFDGQVVGWCCVTVTVRSLFKLGSVYSRITLGLHWMHVQLFRVLDKERHLVSLCALKFTFCK